MDTAAWYDQFAAVDARGSSPVYERLARAVAADGAVVALLDTLPEPKRQPNLLFGVLRLLGVPVQDPGAALGFVVDRWAAVAAQLRVRATQTNEAGRCAALMPALAMLPQPLALLDVGASAGLNLFPDRYRYSYGGPVLGGGDGPLLCCRAENLTPPARLPRVVWRAGLDLHPLDVRDPADVAWLEALIWPEHTHRRERLHAAVAAARAEAPLLVRGDLVDDLPALAARAPAGATLVVTHTSVLYQVPPRRRELFVRRVRELPGHWVCVERADVVPVGGLRGTDSVLSLDGRPLARVHDHGESLTWFG